MLVITRKAGERILLGDDVTVTIVGISGGKVRIGIEAPPQVVVLREELCRKLAQEGETRVDPPYPRHE